MKHILIHTLNYFETNFTVRDDMIFARIGNRDYHGSVSAAGKLFPMKGFSPLTNEYRVEYEDYYGNFDSWMVERIIDSEDEPEYFT